MAKSSSHDLFKLVSGLTYLYPENSFLKNLANAVNKYPELTQEDWLSRGQVESKKWLVEELIKLSFNLGTIYLTPGWYGLLACLIDESNLNFRCIRSFDIDQKSIEVSEALNHSLLKDEWKFKATKLDIFNINYSGNSYATLKYDGSVANLVEVPDTIINTACEHIDFLRWLKMIPSNKLIVLQNNNFRDVKDHLFCVDSIDEFKTKCALTECYYSGVLELNGYSRYMLIGKK